MRKTLLSILAAAAATLALPAAANAATAIATTNVNLRAGPSTAYPAVDVVPAGDDVRIFGCLSNRSWCDVGYRGYRGWMSSNYLAYVRDSRRYTGPRVVEIVRAPTISFSIGSYWDRNYRDRPFYRDRDRFDRDFDGPPRRRDRDDWDRPRRADWDRGDIHRRARQEFNRDLDARLRDIDEGYDDDYRPRRGGGDYDRY